MKQNPQEMMQKKIMMMMVALMKIQGSANTVRKVFHPQRFVYIEAQIRKRLRYMGSALEGKNLLFGIKFFPLTIVLH